MSVSMMPGRTSKTWMPCSASRAAKSARGQQFDHNSGDSLRQKERAFQVDRQHFVPTGLGRL
jgi:hypothetical protein